MKKKINTNITLDSDIYEDIQNECESFECNFSKTANHFLRLGMDLEYKKAMKEAIENKKKENSEEKGKI